MFRNRYREQGTSNYAVFDHSSVSRGIAVEDKSVVLCSFGAGTQERYSDHNQFLIAPLSLNQSYARKRS